MQQPCQDHPQQADHHHKHAEHAEQDQDVPVEEGEGDVAGGVGGGGGALPVQRDPDLAHSETSGVVETHTEILGRCCAAHYYRDVSSTMARLRVKWPVGVP